MDKKRRRVEQSVTKLIKGRFAKESPCRLPQLELSRRDTPVPVCVTASGWSVVVMILCSRQLIIEILFVSFKYFHSKKSKNRATHRDEIFCNNFTAIHRKEWIGIIKLGTGQG